jgi:hypothetical protein
MRDSSLDEFLETGDDSEGDDAAGDDSEGVTEPPDSSEAATAVEERETTEEGAVEATAGDVDEGTAGGAAGGVEPAVSTYDWTPPGADCEACGAAVERRWRDDGRLVCTDCKAW